MATINFSDITLTSKAPEPKEISFGGQVIEVKQWIPIMDKYNIVMITLQEAEEGVYFNEVKIDMYFALNMVYKYTNIAFSAEDRVNADETFDKLNTSGLLSEILAAIPKQESDMIYAYVQEMRDRRMQYGSSISSIFKTFVEDMPKNAEYAKQLADSFDKEKFKEVVEFAQAANGGRPIPVGQK